MIENEFTENVSILLYILCYIHIYFQIRSGSFITNVRVCNSTVLIFLDMYCMLLSIEVTASIEVHRVEGSKNL